MHKSIGFLRGRLKRFLVNESANISVIAGLSIIPIVSMAGFAIDYQMTSTAKSRVQSALDSGVLAASKSMQNGADQDEVKSELRTYVNGLLDAQSGQLDCGQVEVSVPQGTFDIQAAVNCAQPTALLPVIGVEELAFRVSAESTYGIGKIEVAFVFDNSGSMSENGRMDNLKSSATSAVNTLLGGDATAFDSQSVRIAMTTYSSYGNAADYFEDATGLKPTRTIGATNTTKTKTKVCVKWKTEKDKDKDKGKDKDKDKDKAPKCEKYEDVEEIKEEPVSITITNTCVIERRGDEALTDADPGMGKYIEAAARPVWNDNKDSWEYDDAQCPISGPQPLTSAKQDLLDYIDDMTTDEYTAGHIGTAWGWYLLSPDWATVWPAASTPLGYAEPDSTKILVLMTDGVFNRYYDSTHGNSAEQAKKLCDNIKADGITIYTVALEAPEDAAKTLAYCATSPAHAFTPSGAESLTEAYKTIANQISDLRIKS